MGVVIGILELVDGMKMGYHFHTVMKIMILSVISKLYGMTIYTSLATVVVCLYQMRQNKELLAYQYLGFSYYHFMVVFLCIVSAFAIIDIFVLDPSIVPINQKIRTLATKSDAPTILLSSSGVWLRDKDESEYRYIHAKKILIQENTFEDLKILILNKAGQFQSYWHADKAILKDNEWEFLGVKNEKGEENKILNKKTVLLPSDIHVFASQVFIPFIKLSKNINLFKKLNLSTDHYRLLWHRFLAHYLYFFMLLLVGFLIVMRFKSVLFILMVTLFSGLLIYFVSEYILSYITVHYIKKFYLVWIFPTTMNLLLWKRL